MSAAMLAHYAGPITLGTIPDPSPCGLAVRAALTAGPQTVRRLALVTGYTEDAIRKAIRDLGYRVGGRVGGLRRVGG